jgi:8-oxo-dGTP pyrophosphatase MutT (NUDIX family)
LVEGIEFNKTDLRDHDGIAMIIRNEEDKYLLMKHNKLDTWTLPVGKVEYGETKEETLRKEAFEELNISLLNYDLVSLETRKYKRMNKVIKVRSFLYNIINYKGNLINKEPHKHDEIRWFTIKEIKKLNQISDATKDFLRYNNFINNPIND